MKTPLRRRGGRSRHGSVRLPHSPYSLRWRGRHPLDHRQVELRGGGVDGRHRAHLSIQVDGQNDLRPSSLSRARATAAWSVPAARAGLSGCRHRPEPPRRRSSARHRGGDERDRRNHDRIARSQIERAAGEHGRAAVPLEQRDCVARVDPHAGKGILEPLDDGSARQPRRPEYVGNGEDRLPRPRVWRPYGGGAARRS